jgi:hypothetical protein
MENPESDYEESCIDDAGAGEDIDVGAPPEQESERHYQREPSHWQ